MCDIIKCTNINTIRAPEKGEAKTRKIFEKNDHDASQILSRTNAKISYQTHHTKNFES